MFLIFILLLTVHIFADFYLQLTRLAGNKRKNILALAVHALTWALMICLVLFWAGIFLPWKFYFLFASHFIIDWFKIRLFKASFPLFHAVNVTDQLLHLGTILLTVFYV